MTAQSLESFLDAIASDRPVPAGGSASALAAATAAGLVAMCCRLTIGRERYREHEETMREVLAASERLRADALRLAFEDIAAYTNVDAARSLPRETAEQVSVRSAVIQEALQGATRSPLQIARQASRVLVSCRSVVDGANVNTLSDLGVAALLARAALDGAALSVRTNLRLIEDEAFKEEMTAELERLEASRPLCDEVLQAIESRSPK